MKYYTIYKHTIFRRLLPYKLIPKNNNEEELKCFELILNNDPNKLNTNILKKVIYYDLSRILTQIYEESKDTFEDFVKIAKHFTKDEMLVYGLVYEEFMSKNINTIKENERKFVKGIETILLEGKPKSPIDLLNRMKAKVKYNVNNASREELIEYINNIKQIYSIAPGNYILTKENVPIRISDKFNELLPKRNRYRIYSLNSLLRELFSGFPNVEKIIEEFKGRDVKENKKIKKIYSDIPTVASLKELKNLALREIKECMHKKTNNNKNSLERIIYQPKVVPKLQEKVKYEIITYNNQTFDLPNENYIAIVGENGAVDIYRYGSENRRIDIFFPKKRKIKPIDLGELEEKICDMLSIPKNKARIFIHRQ